MTNSPYKYNTEQTIDQRVAELRRASHNLDFLTALATMSKAQYSISEDTSDSFFDIYDIADAKKEYTDVIVPADNDCVTSLKNKDSSAFVGQSDVIYALCHMLYEKAPSIINWLDNPLAHSDPASKSAACYKKTLVLDTERFVGYGIGSDDLRYITTAVKMVLYFKPSAIGDDILPFTVHTISPLISRQIPVGSLVCTGGANSSVATRGAYAVRGRLTSSAE